METHFSLDIETLDTETSAVVLSIGCTRFIPATEERHGFHVSLDLEQQLAMGRTISTDTFHWWAKELARMSESPFPDEPIKPAEALWMLRDYLIDQSQEPNGHLDMHGKDRYVWLRGPHFDWSILENLAKQCDVNLPVLFHRVSDQRTFCRPYEMAIKGAVPSVTKHNALEDARYQAEALLYVVENFDKPLT